INVEGVRATVISPARYELTGNVTNTSEDAREVTLRAQITFYDRTAPKGDLPLDYLRKDITEVLRPGENRAVRVVLLRSGAPLHDAVRLEPFLRIRRQRVWLLNDKEVK
ncbi:MAG: hypothetical protein L0Z48_13015, partial [candidate division Zixibacteria bacterium]|nr:hypothetical protein [candidate division Zixibacteria bacterium]